MKTAKVMINEKEYILREYRNKDLSALMDVYKEELAQVQLTGGPVDMYNTLIAFIQEKLVD